MVFNKDFIICIDLTHIAA